MTDKALTQTLNDSSQVAALNRLRLRKLRNGANITFVTALALALLGIFLAPFLFMVFTSLKTQGQITQLGAPIWPAKPTTYDYNGKSVDVLKVPMSTCAGSN